MSRKRKPYKGTNPPKQSRDEADHRRRHGQDKRARKRIRADRQQSGRSIRPPWGIWCMRSHLSCLGAAEAWAKEHGQIILTTERTARETAARLTSQSPRPIVTYEAREYNPGKEGT